MDSKLVHHTPGIRFADDGTAEIAVWAPVAAAASVKLVHTNSNLELQQQPYGYWTLDTTALHPGDEYKIILDGKEYPDIASLSQPEGVHGFSRAMDLAAYQWTDTDWKNPQLEKYIFYEIHVGTFTPGGTFSALQEKLPYLKKLGITAIELMPLASFPGTRNWGYDGVFPFAVQESYGGAEGLQQLVDACHKNKLAVVLDVVYNHLGPEGNYLSKYGPFFTGKYCTPWGEAVNYDDAWCDGVRNYIISNALMWFRDFHIDALRLDAVHAIRDFGARHVLQELRERTDELCAETGRKHYLIIECDLNDSRYIESLQEKGFGMDAQWSDEFHHALRVASGQKREGYFADFNGLEHLAKAYRDAYVYNGIYSPHRLRTFGSKASAKQGNQFVVFSQNHDQVGNRMLGERTSALVSFEMQKLLAGAVMVSPYLPLLFMGEEWREPAPFQYFISHTDPELVQAVRNGRREEFKAFHYGDEVPDPQSEETFLQSKLHWELQNEEVHACMLRYYKEIILLRKHQPALYRLDRQTVAADHDESKGMLILQRRRRNQQIICLMNFSGSEQHVEMPAGYENWMKLLDSADPQWGGPFAAPGLLPGNISVTLQPESLLIYGNKYV